MALITVMVPVYKAEAYICRCVESIRNQTFSDFDLILVDDGSPDACPEILDRYTREDSRIHVIHQENTGVAAARNACIEWALAYSDSEWLAFVDADDWIHRDYLKILYEEVQKSNVKMAVCERQRVDHFSSDVEKKTVRFEYLTMDDAFARYYSGCNSPALKLCAKELYRDLRFPLGMYYEDVFLTYRLVLAAGMVAVTGETLYYYYCNTGSITRRRWTEHRLDQIAAHETRLAFLKENGYKNAYARCVLAYIQVLTEQAQLLDELRRENKKYRILRDEMRQKLRRTMAECPENVKIVMNDDNHWIYAQVYPNKVIRKLRFILAALNGRNR